MVLTSHLFARIVSRMPRTSRSKQPKFGRSERGVSVKMDMPLYKALKALAVNNGRTIVGQLRWLVAQGERTQL